MFSIYLNLITKHTILTNLNIRSDMNTKTEQTRINNTIRSNTGTWPNNRIS